MAAAKEVPSLPGQGSVEFPVLRCEEGRWRLSGSRCQSCGKTYYPPRSLCPEDLGRCTGIVLSERGVVHAATWVRRPPLGFEGEFRVAYVDLPEGVRVFAKLIWDGEGEPLGGDAAELAIGPVRQEPPVVGPCFRGSSTGLRH
jgi:uncharacterized OB-fold protein